MAITYEWVINQMDAYPTYEGKSNVVFTIHWSLTGTDGTHTGSTYGTAGVTYEAGKPFTAFDKLTKSQVEGWILNTLGEEQVTSLKTGIASQIANLANPPVVNPPLPWVSTPSSNT